MEHLAILTKKLKFIPLIADRKKLVETRWYKNKIAPWGKLNQGDTIYFQESGSFINLVAKVGKVYQDVIEDDNGRRKIIKEIWGKDVVFEKNINYLEEYSKGKRYVIIFEILDPKYIEPFKINKTGFGSQCAWICIDSIIKLKK